MEWKAQDTVDDRSLLLQYFEELADDLATSFHVFISYRVASERKVAKALFEALSATTVEGTGQRLRVYLDTERLKDGSRWDEGFMQSLGSTWIVVPLVSSEALAPMMNMETKADPDNFLLEMIAALELHSRGAVKAILPVVLPSADGTEFAWELQSQLATEEHDATVTAACKHLHTHASSAEILSPEDHSNLQVSGVCLLYVCALKVVPYILSCY